jgi:hypothetical protein
MAVFRRERDSALVNFIGSLDMVSIRSTIVIKTDRLNADDLIGGATKTITITGVRAVNDAAQPLAINFAGDGGKPYYPCLSMRKMLAFAWGDDGDAYAGRSLTLIRDDRVKYGKDEVGGLRITHLSHIKADVTLALTVTRGIKKPYTVKPLRVVPGANISTESARGALEVAANDGLAALQEAWTALPSAVRKAVSPSGCPEDLKAIAAGVDREREESAATQAKITDALAGDGGATAKAPDKAAGEPPAEGEWEHARNEE